MSLCQMKLDAMVLKQLDHEPKNFSKLAFDLQHSSELACGEPTIGEIRNSLMHDLQKGYVAAYLPNGDRGKLTPATAEFSKLNLYWYEDTQAGAEQAHA